MNPEKALKIKADVKSKSLISRKTSSNRKEYVKRQITGKPSKTLPELSGPAQTRERIRRAYDKATNERIRKRAKEKVEAYRYGSGGSHGF